MRANFTHRDRAVQLPQCHGNDVRKRRSVEFGHLNGSGMAQDAFRDWGACQGFTLESRVAHATIGREGHEQLRGSYRVTVGVAAL